MEPIERRYPDAARLNMREHLQRVEADIQTILAGPRQAVPAGRRPRE